MVLPKLSGMRISISVLMIMLIIPLVNAGILDSFNTTNTSITLCVVEADLNRAWNFTSSNNARLEEVQIKLNKSNTSNLTVTLQLYKQNLDFLGNSTTVNFSTVANGIMDFNFTFNNISISKNESYIVNMKTERNTTNCNLRVYYTGDSSALNKWLGYGSLFSSLTWVKNFTHDYRLFGNIVESIVFNSSYPINNQEIMTNATLIIRQNVTIINVTANCSLNFNGVSHAIEGNFTNTTIELNHSVIPNIVNNSYYFLCTENLTNATISSSSVNFYAGGILNITARLYNGTTINSFNITNGNDYSTNTGNITIRLNREQNVSYYFDVDGYEYKNFNISFNNTFYQYNVSVYRTNTLNITIKNESNNAIINNVSMELISDIYSNNYTTTTGNFFIEVLYPTPYILRYRATGYNERFYYFELINRTYNNITLYLLSNNTGTQVTAQVYDELSNVVEGAYIKVLKFNTATNSYELKEIVSTNFEGKAIMNIMLNSEFYKFIIEYPYGSVVSTTNPSYISTSTITFRVSLSEPVLDDFFNVQDISTQLYFNNATNNFNFIYTDSTNLLTEGCLYVYDISILKSTLVNYTCISAASGNILLAVDNVTGKSYEAKAYVSYDSDRIFIKSIQKTFPESQVGGKSGAFWIYILTLIFICIGYYSRTIALILAPLPLLLGSFLNIILLDRGIAIFMLILTWGLAFMISKK